MRLPIIPFLVAAIILAIAVYFLTVGGTPRLVLDAPRLSQIADLQGIETEVAIAPDGNRYAVIAAGDLWLFDLSDGSQNQITHTVEPEEFPDWTPDGTAVTFTRGSDTFIFRPATNSTEILKANARSLSWSPTGRFAFTRDRALWLADANGENERQIVEADSRMDVTIHSPRFALDSIQLGFIKTQLDLRGEIWVVDVLTGQARPVVADRPAENPMALGWIRDGKDLVYLTNRTGTYSLWYVDFAESTILPLTLPLVTVPLDRLGIGVWKDRIVLPRHFVDSNLVLSDGTNVIGTENVEFQPAVSPDGRLVAYTLARDNQLEIWTATITGGDPKFRALGREPRFSPRGFELLYTHTDLGGNDDLWKIDLRNHDSERMTDANEVDVTPDWSPDGRSIVFSSTRGGSMSVWTIGSTGGRRLRINESGYSPRYSPDGRSILFWNAGALWSMNADGSNPRLMRGGFPEPLMAAWTKDGPVTHLDSTLQAILPEFDILPDGRWIAAPIQIRETALWAVDLMYKEN
jgi:TolB protein